MHKSSVACFLPLLLMIPITGWCYVVRINCGAERTTYSEEIRYERDIEYTTGSYGYIGGEQQHYDQLVGGTSQNNLHRQFRVGLSEYRFTVPNGLYIVKLYFAERVLHDANLRVMNIQIEDSIVLRDFDIHSYRGKDYLVPQRYLVEVTDGELNVEFSASIGETIISAISVLSAEPNTTTPIRPSRMNAWSSYNSVIVDWLENLRDYDLAGFYLYRTTGSDWIRVTPDPLNLNSYIDRDVETGVEYQYKVKAVDLFGNESEFSPISEPTEILEKGDTDIPIYNMYMHESDLSFLMADPFRDIYIRGHFEHEERLWEYLRIRIRGSFSRNFPKKGWKVNFRSDDSYFGINKLNFNGEFGDPTHLKKIFGTNLFAMAGIDAPVVNYANIWLNDRYDGLYINIEQVDEVYLNDRGYSEHDYLYKNNNSGYQLHRSYDGPWGYKTGSGEADDYHQIKSFTEILHSTPDYKAESVFDSLLNVESVLKYLAIISLIDDRDYTYQNHYLHREGSTGKWHVIPWDVNFSFHNSTRPLGLGSFYHPYDLIVGPNMFITRIMGIESYRNRYADLVDSLSLTLFDTSFVITYTDSLIDYIAVDVCADRRKNYWESCYRWVAKTDTFADIALSRADFLRSQVDDFKAFENPTGIFINELCVNNHVYPDDFLEYDPFVELYNAGDEPFDIGHLYLSDEPFSQHKWRLPSFELPPGEFIIVWLDNQPEQGPFHSTLEVDSTGGFIGLFDGRHEHHSFLPAIDLLFYGEFVDGRSWQRYPDGGNEWSFADPTPRSSNIHQVAEDIRLPDQLLVKAFPNPFNSSVSINLPSKTENLLIYDTRGKQIAEFKGINSVNSVVWSPSDELSSGLYLLRAISQSGREISRAKVVYIK